MPCFVHPVAGKMIYGSNIAEWVVICEGKKTYNLVNTNPLVNRFVICIMNFKTRLVNPNFSACGRSNFLPQCIFRNLFYFHVLFFSIIHL